MAVCTDVPLVGETFFGLLRKHLKKNDQPDYDLLIALSKYYTGQKNIDIGYDSENNFASKYKAHGNGKTILFPLNSNKECLLRSTNSKEYYQQYTKLQDFVQKNLSINQNNTAKFVSALLEIIEHDDYIGENFRLKGVSLHPDDSVFLPVKDITKAELIQANKAQIIHVAFITFLLNVMVFAYEAPGKTSGPSHLQQIKDLPPTRPVTFHRSADYWYYVASSLNIKKPFSISIVLSAMEFFHDFTPFYRAFQFIKADPLSDSNTFYRYCGEDWLKNIVVLSAKWNGQKDEFHSHSRLYKICKETVILVERICSLFSDIGSVYRTTLPDPKQADEPSNVQAVYDGTKDNSGGILIRSRRHTSDLQEALESIKISYRHCEADFLKLSTLLIEYIKKVYEHYPKISHDDATPPSVFGIVPPLSYLLDDGNDFTCVRRLFEQKHLPFDRLQMKCLHLLDNEQQYTAAAMVLSDKCQYRTILRKSHDGINKRTLYECSGSLLDQYSDLTEHLNAFMKENDIDCPADAICEALINSLIHRDYSIDKNAYIEFEQDRIVFITPVGSSLFDHLNSINPGEWHIHNPEIANVFRLLSLATLYGTGIPKIYKAYKGTNYKPSYRIGGNEFLMSLPLIKRPQIAIDNDVE